MVCSLFKIYVNIVTETHGSFLVPITMKSICSHNNEKHCSDPTKLIPNHSAPSEASGIDLCRWGHHAVRDHKSLSMEVGFGRTIAV